MSEEIKPIQQVLSPDGRPVFANFGTIEDIKARLYASLQWGPQSAVWAKIQEEVTKIATEFNYPYPVVEQACQTLCSRRTCTVNETLSLLRSGDVELKREFIIIIQEQQPNE